jgi:hypothetical protein
LSCLPSYTNTYYELGLVLVNEYQLLNAHMFPHKLHFIYVRHYTLYNRSLLASLSSSVSWYCINKYRSMLHLHACISTATQCWYFILLPSKSNYLTFLPCSLSLKQQRQQLKTHLDQAYVSVMLVKHSSSFIVCSLGIGGMMENPSNISWSRAFFGPTGCRVSVVAWEFEDRLLAFPVSVNDARSRKLF